MEIWLFNITNEADIKLDLAQQWDQDVFSSNKELKILLIMTTKSITNISSIFLQAEQIQFGISKYYLTT